MEKQNESADQMAPRKNESEFPPNGAKTEETYEEEDMAEFEAVNESLDEISRALDFIEQRTDNIRAEALAWLASRNQPGQNEEKTANSNNQQINAE